MEKQLIIFILIFLVNLNLFSQISDGADVYVRNVNDGLCSFNLVGIEYDFIATSNRLIKSNYCGELSNSLNQVGEILVINNDEPINQLISLNFNLTSISFYQGLQNKIRVFDDKLYSVSRVCVNNDIPEFLPLSIEIRKFDLNTSEYTSIFIDTTFNTNDLVFSILDGREINQDAFQIFYKIRGEIASANLSDGILISLQHHGLRPQFGEIINCQTVRMINKDLLCIQWRDSTDNQVKINIHEINEDGISPSPAVSYLDFFSSNALSGYQMQSLGDFLIRSSYSRLVVYDQELNIIFNYNFSEGDDQGQVKLIELFDNNILRVYNRKLQTPRGIDLFEINLNNNTITKKDSIIIWFNESNHYNLSYYTNVMRITENKLIILGISASQSTPSNPDFILTLVDNELNLISQQIIQNLSFEQNISSEIFISKLIENNITGFFNNLNLEYIYRLGLGEELSVSEIKKSSFDLFPNPTTNQIQIQYTRQDFSQYFISDLQGRKIKSGNIDPQSEQSEIDVQELSQGIYLLSLQGKKGAAVRKFVKQ